MARLAKLIQLVAVLSAALALARPTPDDNGQGRVEQTKPQNDCDLAVVRGCIVPRSRVASEVVWIFIGLAPVFLVFLMALIVHQIMKRREKKEKEARAQASAQA
jgi:hypothetical protein